MTCWSKYFANKRIDGLMKLFERIVQIILFVLMFEMIYWYTIFFVIKNFKNWNIKETFFFFPVLQINLRLILVSGKTKEFLFSPSDSAGDIAHHVFENWPEGTFLLKFIYIVISYMKRLTNYMILFIKDFYYKKKQINKRTKRNKNRLNKIYESLTIFINEFHIAYSWDLK